MYHQTTLLPIRKSTLIKHSQFTDSIPILNYHNISLFSFLIQNPIQNHATFRCHVPGHQSFSVYNSSSFFPVFYMLSSFKIYRPFILQDGSQPGSVLFPHDLCIPNRKTTIMMLCHPVLSLGMLILFS